MVEYRKVGFTYGGVHFGILLEPPQGSSALVAIHNCMRFLEGSQTSAEFVESTVDEQEVRKTIGAALKGSLDASTSLKYEVKQYVRNVLHDISPKFRVSPLPSAPKDFEHGGAYFLFRCLGIELMHGWLVSPEVSIYESIKGCTEAKLKSAKAKAVGEDREVIKGLLRYSRLQLTAYGFRCLAANVVDGEFVLLFWDNRFDILFKTYGELFVLVTDEGRRRKMPKVTWMLFEHSQQQNIYLKEDFSPVTGQPYEKRAGEWHKRFLEKISEAKRNEVEAQSAAEAAEREAAEWDKGIDEEIRKIERNLAAAAAAEREAAEAQAAVAAAEREAAVAESEPAEWLKGILEAVRNLAAAEAAEREAAEVQAAARRKKKNQKKKEARKRKSQEDKSSDQHTGNEETGHEGEHQAVISPPEEKEAEVGPRHVNSSGNQVDVDAAASVHPEVDNVLATDFLKFLVE